MRVNFRIKLLIFLVVCLAISHLIFTLYFTEDENDLVRKHFKKASVFEKDYKQRAILHVRDTIEIDRANGENKPHHLKLNESKENDVLSTKIDIKKKNYKKKAKSKDSDDKLLLKNHNRWGMHYQHEFHNANNLKVLFNQSCKPVNYSSYQTEKFCLKNDSFERYFMTENGKTFCLREGTEFLTDSGTKCRCKSKWYGSKCSMPLVIYKSNYPHEYGYTYQNPPRRLINAFPFNQEFDLLETRFHEYGHLVDLYIIVESNYTASGRPKPRYLKEKLDSGEFSEFQNKILYLDLDYFPKKAYYNGWIIDALLRNYIAEKGLSNIMNLREDDVFLINDADELPMREAVMFLKLHMSYPEPVGMFITHNVYGFQWLGDDFTTHVYGACSMGMLYHVFGWNPYALREARRSMAQNAGRVDNYKYKHSGRIHDWSMGNTSLPAGWHCSWCFRPEGIKAKLEAAHWSDLPRWGAYPSKTSIEYIRNLTERGVWFDDRTKFSPSKVTAPKYIFNNIERFKHLFGNMKIEPLFLKLNDLSNDKDEGNIASKQITKKSKVTRNVKNTRSEKRVDNNGDNLLSYYKDIKEQRYKVDKNRRTIEKLLN